MNHIIKIFITLLCVILPTNVLFAKGYEEIQGLIIAPYSILSGLIITNTGGLLFTGVRGDSNFDGCVPIIYGTDSISSGTFTQKYGNLNAIDPTNHKYYALNSIKLNDGKFVVCDQVNMSLYARVFNTDLTVKTTITNYPRGATDGFAVNCKNSNDWLLIVGSTGGVSIERYDINGTYIKRTSVAVSTKVKDAISINANEVILMTEGTLIKVGSSATTQVLPTDVTFWHMLDMQDGTFVAVGNDTSNNVVLVGFDENLTILSQKTLTGISYKYTTNTNLKKFACYKSQNKFILLGYINKLPYLIELDKDFNILSQDEIEIPYVDMGKLTPICQGLTIYNKKVIVNLVLWDGWGSRPYAGYAVYKPIPPTINITAAYQQIGDNTPVTININVPEDYPILSISNTETGQIVYTGSAISRYSFYWDRLGNYNFKATIYDTDSELLSTSNTVMVNQTKSLSKILDIIDSKSTLQKMIILDDADRYYENNATNQKLVSQIKERVDGIFLIGNDVSPVLVPLLG